jgi:hypothetical protein
MDGVSTTLLDRPTRIGLILLALAQGCALYLLHLTIDTGVWPATDMRWLKALYTVFIALPAVFYLGVERLAERRNGLVAVVLGVLLFFLGWHLGWVESVAGVEPSARHTFTPAFVLSLGVMLFILIFFFRAWSAAGSLRFDYERLLTFSWQQALTLGMLGLFVGVFWLLLWLWADLFSVIGIDAFKELFSKPIFIYPVTWLIGGFGLVLIRDRIRLIATVQLMCEVLTRALLPLAAVIVVLFLGALPLTGLQPIWNTGRAALLMLLLAVVLLFFFNAVLSGDPERPPYPVIVRRLVFLTIMLLPASVLLAAWALWLRIEQYGLTLDRLWAAVMLLLIAAYAFSYAVLLLWQRDRALWSIQTVNRRLALVVVAVLLAVNTPVADLRAWAANDQVVRLLRGKVDSEGFDYVYLRFSLGAYGDRALRRIAQSDLARDNPTVAKRVADVLKMENRRGEPVVDKTDMVAVASAFMVEPAGAAIPEPLLRKVVDSESHCLRRSNSCRAVRLPASDGGADWMFMNGGRSAYVYGKAYALREGTWLHMGDVGSAGCDDSARGEVGRVAMRRVPGPFLVYSDGRCFYSVTPKRAYLLQLTGADGGVAE